MSEQMYEDVAPTWQQDAMRGRLASHIINALRRNAPAIREAMPKDAYGWATLPAKATVAMARGVGNEVMSLAQKQRAAIESGDMDDMGEMEKPEVKQENEEVVLDKAANKAAPKK